MTLLPDRKPAHTRLSAPSVAEVFRRFGESQKASPTPDGSRLLSHVTTICFVDGPQVLVCRDEAGFYIGSAINIDQNNDTFFSALSYPIAFSRVSKETLDLFLANTICLRTACTKDAQDRVVIADLKNSRSVCIAQNDYANSLIWICVGRECPLHDWMLADEGLMFSDIQDFDGLPEPEIRKALSIGLEPVA